VKNILSNVLALQKVELHIFKAISGMSELPREIEEIDSIIQARKHSLEVADEEIAELNGRKEPLEVELKENQSILDAADARIKKIKTNKEFLALQREIDIAKKRKSDLEEQILQIMEKIEARTKERDRISKTFENDRVVLDDKKEVLLSKQRELQAIIDKLKGQLDALRVKVDRALLSRYDRIKEKRNGLVVVECMDGVCMGCHIHIQPQLYNELVRGDKMISCPACQRILYINTSEEEQANKKE
jgi:predicted  nucleic acid-binding Zn-ribbon protein